MNLAWGRGFGGRKEPSSAAGLLPLLGPSGLAWLSLFGGVRPGNRGGVERGESADWRLAGVAPLYWAGAALPRRWVEATPRRWGTCTVWDIWGTVLGRRGCGAETPGWLATV